jgi:hypothetical protein
MMFTSLCLSNVRKVHAVISGFYQIVFFNGRGGDFTVVHNDTFYAPELFDNTQHSYTFGAHNRLSPRSGHCPLAAR